MASIEEDILRDVYQVIRMLSSRMAKKRSSNLSRRMRDAQQRGPARAEELRALLENLRDERSTNPEFANAVDQLPDDLRTQRMAAEAEWQQDQRDRMDADPDLTPEDIQREVEEQRDRDHNGLDDDRDRELQTDEVVEERRDPDHNGQDNAVEDRAADRAERDAAEERRKQEEQRRQEAQQTEEARGGDVLPAAAAAGATAVAADEILDEVEDQRQDQELEDQQPDEQTQVLDEDGAAPEVIGETDQERDARLAEPEAEQDDRVLDEDGAAPEVIGETDQERDARLAEPEAEQDDRVLDEDGAAPEVIGETDQERDARLAEPEAEQDDRVLDEDGAAPEVIGETDQERDARLAEPEAEAGQDDRVLDEDGASPAVIGEQDGQEQGQDQPGAGGSQSGLRVRGQDGQEVPREADGSINGQAFTISRQEAQADGQSQQDQRPPDPLETNLAEARAANGRSSVTIGGKVGDVEINGQLPDGAYQANDDGSMSYQGTTESGQQVNMNVGAGSTFGDGGQQLGDEEVSRLRDFQQGDHAPAAEATRQPSGEPVGAGVGGKNAGARAAELRTDKGPSRDGGRGMGE